MSYNPNNPNGQAAMDDSQPVVIASNQSAVPVSASSLPLPSGAATGAKQDTGNTSLASIDGKITAVNTGAVVVSSSALPTGAATSAKQDTGNTSLATIAGAVAGTEVQVDVLTSALPTGAATSAKQDTMIGHLDGVETTLTAIDGRVDGLEASNSAIQTAVELIDDTVTTLGTSTYTEATSKGITIGAVRRDADTTLVNTTNEFGPLQMDANGRLKVEAFSGETLPVSLVSTTITGTVAVTQSGTWDEVGINDSGNSITVDNGGTFATQENGAALTALQLIDDPVAVLGTATYTEASTKGNIVAAVRRDADTTLVDTTNEVAPLQVDARGALKVEAFSGETLPVSLATVPSHAVTNAGTFAVQVDGNALTALQLIDDTVFVDDAAFTPATSKVNSVGFLADSTSTDSVDEGDIGAARMTLDRRQIVAPYEDPSNSVSGAITSAMTGTTSTSLVAAPGAGLRNYITTIIVSNSHATVGTDVIIQDGSGGTTLLTIPAAAVYGGGVITLPMPLRQPTANTALFCANVTTGASTKVSAVGFKAA
jgi:hypothetical protein